MYTSASCRGLISVASIPTTAITLEKVFIFLTARLQNVVI